MVKFFGCNGQAFISKKQKDLLGKSIPFVLKWYGKMSLPDNLESQSIILSINPRIFPLFYWFYFLS